MSNKATSLTEATAPSLLPSPAGGSSTGVGVPRAMTFDQVLRRSLHTTAAVCGVRYQEFGTYGEIPENLDDAPEGTRVAGRVLRLTSRFSRWMACCHNRGQTIAPWTPEEKAWFALNARPFRCAHPKETQDDYVLEALEWYAAHYGLDTEVLNRGDLDDEGKPLFQKLRGLLTNSTSSNSSG